MALRFNEQMTVCGYKKKSSRWCCCGFTKQHVLGINEMNIYIFGEQCVFCCQDDKRLPQEVRPTTLQGSGADEGRVCVPGPLRVQVPGPSRETGTEAHRALCAGRGNYEESSGGEWIETPIKKTQRLCREFQGFGLGITF